MHKWSSTKIAERLGRAREEEAAVAGVGEGCDGWGSTSMPCRDDRVVSRSLELQ